MLFTAMVGPYFVNWTSYRSAFEREASRYLGQNVTVSGKADLRLLPTPVLSFADVRVGDPDTPHLVIERFRAEVELMPLLKGEFNILDMIVERPTLQFDLANLDTIKSTVMDELSVNPEKIALNDVVIEQGEALILDSRTGQQWTASRINAVVDARSLAGPAKIDGAMIFDGEPVNFRLATGRRNDGGGIPLKVSLTPSQVPLSVLMDGQLVFRDDGPPSYVATVSVGGRVEEDEGSDADPFGISAVRLTGEVVLTTESLVAENLQISYGPEDRPLQLSGKAEFSMRKDRHFSVQIGARQIDLDRIIGGGPSEPISVERALAVFRQVATTLPAPSMPGELTFNARALVVGGSVLQNASAVLVPRGSAWHVESVQARLPGESSLEARGRLVPGRELVFEGWARLTSGRPAAFAAWWRGDPGSAARIGPFSVEANIGFSPGSRVADNIIAKTTEGTVTGMVAARNFAASEDVFVSIELAADRFDIDKGRAIINLLSGGAYSSNNIDRISLDLRARELVAGGIVAKAVTIEGDLEDNGLDLRRLFIADLAGARVEADGRIQDLFGEPNGRFDAGLRAEDLQGAVTFFTSLFPDSALASHLVAVSPGLAPVDANLSLVAGESDRAVGIDLVGKFAGTRVSVSAKGDGGLADPLGFVGEIETLMVGPDVAIVLTQLGLPVLPLPDLGPARISANLSGSLREGTDLTLEAEGAGASLGFSGQAKVGAQGLTVSGSLEADSNNIDPVLLMAGVALPGLGEGHAVQLDADLVAQGKTIDLSIKEAGFEFAPINGTLRINFEEGLEIDGALDLTDFSIPMAFATNSGMRPNREDGNWPDREFRPALPDNLDLRLDLSVQSVDLGLPIEGRNANFELIQKGDMTEIAALEADFAGGRLSGDYRSILRNGEIDLSIRAGIENAALEEIVWRSNDRSMGQGKISATLEVEGQGHTLSGLVSTLTGSGSFIIEDGVARAVNPQAFSSVIRAYDANPELKEDQIRTVFEGHLDSGSLAFDKATGSFSITSGVARLSSLSLSTETATALGGASIDLNTMTIDSDWSMKVDPGINRVAGAEPEVGLVFNGPIGDPSRMIDINPFVGYLTVRAFEQEVERIETLQADILEKERLERDFIRFREDATRRKQEAEEAERRKIEAERAAAEAARLAAEEAERKRKEEEQAAAEAARVAAEDEAARKQLEEERAAAEAERQRLEAARAEAERNRQAAEKAAREAEEIAARQAIEREAERVRLEEERAAAQAERKRLEAERAALELERRAAAEAARLAEVEAARLAAEREAERQHLEDERKAAELERLRLEEERLAAESARKAAEQAARVAAETAAREIAEEEAARLRLEEERAAAKAERLALEQAIRAAEAERLAAEDAATMAAEKAALEAAEKEAARLKLEEERAAAEEERLRLAEKRAAAEAAREAAEEAARRAEADALRRAADEEAARLRLQEELAAAEAERLRLEQERMAAEAARRAAEEQERRAKVEAERLAAEREAERLRLEAERAAAEAERLRLERERAAAESDRDTPVEESEQPPAIDPAIIITDDQAVLDVDRRSIEALARGSGGELPPLPELNTPGLLRDLPEFSMDGETATGAPFVLIPEPLPDFPRQGQSLRHLPVNP